MKFNFTIQPYQTEAVDSVVQVFEGQPLLENSAFTRDVGQRAAPQQTAFGGHGQPPPDDTGYRNGNIALADVELLRNLHAVQQQGNIKQSARLSRALGRCSLDVEMETGTGKTYVYIKTMFRLNQRYGWSKFIVVVPSVAIREGVKKTFEMTADHFMQHYGKKARYFVYNSANLARLDEFAASPGIQVMIINTQAFASSLREDGTSKEARIIYSKRDDFASRRPIDVISAVRPIVILDEPQKMGGSVTQNALKKFTPLFSVNYSATHKDLHNPVYVLDALDAYNKRLVKKIRVKGFEVKNFRGTDGYLYLGGILLSPSKPPLARLEFEVNFQKSINRETRLLGAGANLYRLSAGKNMPPLAQYQGYTIAEVDAVAGRVVFTNGVQLATGSVVGDVSESDMRRVQIRETILSHLERERDLFERGIKTLSLFFIDEVAKYRRYGEGGEELPGEYARVFEQEYAALLAEELARLEEGPYRQYLARFAPGEVHQGYFSIDKKTRRAVNSETKRGSDISDDISAYDLILRNKERLLSFEEPTRFIFSHSALREGWDNPNVFQICTLKHSDSATQKRQEVGRGLRLCVDKDGNRMDRSVLGRAVHDVNKLTVIASESYALFVTELQKQIREVLYSRPATAGLEYFIGKTVLCDGQRVMLDERQAREIYRYLLKNDYVDDEDRVADAYREDMDANRLAALPGHLAPMAEGIHRLVQSVFSEAALAGMMENAGQPTVVENPLNDNFRSPAFQALWGRINHKYAYRVQFSSEELVAKAVEAINGELFVSQLQYTKTEAEQAATMNADALGRGESFGARRTKTETLAPGHTSGVPYDLVGRIAQGATLTRKTAAHILAGIAPQKMEMFRYNPEEFINRATRLVQGEKARLIVQNITYRQIPGRYGDDIFTARRHSAGLGNAFRAQKHIQDYVFVDGTAKNSVERRFAESLEAAVEVEVYAKLPLAYSIPTPVGPYSPDWAIAFKKGSVKHMCFVAETKGTLDSLQNRPIERAKILCARKLFNEISTEDVVYHDVDDYDALLRVMQAL